MTIILYALYLFSHHIEFSEHLKKKHVIVIISLRLEYSIELWAYFTSKKKKSHGILSPRQAQLGEAKDIICKIPHIIRFDAENNQTGLDPSSQM